MPPESLRCKECKTSYPLEARYACEECFGPLEVRYDFGELDPEHTRRKIQAGPASGNGCNPFRCNSTAIVSPCHGARKHLPKGL